MANQYGKRFIEAKDFARYYAELASDTQDRPSDSDILSELEFFEKEKLLFPCLRLVVSQAREIEAAKAQELRWQDNIVKWPPDGWPELWYRLEKKLHAHDSFWEVGTKQTEQPFEDISGLEEFFSDPKLSPFKPWKSYCFEADIGDRKRTLNQSNAYYHYWQIHLLDAIRRENTIRILTTERMLDVADVLKGRINRTISTHRISSGYRWLVGSTNLAKAESLHEQLSKYVSECKHITAVIYWRSRDSYPSSISWSEDEQLEFESLCKSRAARIVGESGSCRDDWIRLLQVLCDLWGEYDDYGRRKIAGELKRDISYLYEFLSDAYDTPLEEAISLSGDPPYGGTGKRRLELVFPDRIADAKKETLRFLKATLRKYNPNVTPEFQITEDDIAELCNYAEGEDFNVLFQAVEGILSERERRTQFHILNQFGQLRSLSVFVEDLIKSLNREFLRNRTCIESSDSEDRTTTLEGDLKGMFDNGSAYNIYGYSDHKCYTSNVPPTQVAMRIDEVLSKRFICNPSQNFMVQRLFIFKMTRDFSAHKAGMPRETFKSTFGTMLYSTLYSMFFVWVFHKNRTAVRGYETGTTCRAPT